MDRIIGIIHIGSMLFETVYGFLPGIHSAITDKIYLTSILSLPFSWILCKGECYISYLMKKMKNPDYVLGDEAENVQDIIELFHSYKTYVHFYHVNHGIRILSLLSTYYSLFQKIDPIFLANLGLYSFYVYDIFYKTEIQKKIPEFPICFCIGLSHSIIVIWYHHR